MRRAFLPLLLLTATACGKRAEHTAAAATPVVDPARAAYQKALAPLAADEEAALAALAGATGPGYKSDDALLDTLRTTTLPRYRAFVDGLGHITPIGDPLGKLHARLLAAARAELALLLQLEDALARGDADAVAAANQEQRRVRGELDAVLAEWNAP